MAVGVGAAARPGGVQSGQQSAQAWTTTLKELLDYTQQQEALTARFVEHGRKRCTEMDRLIAAAGNDLSMLWRGALNRLADAGVPGQRGSETTEDRTALVMA